MHESVSYKPPADVQKTGVEDAGALNFHRKGQKKT